LARTRHSAFARLMAHPAGAQHLRQQDPNRVKSTSGPRRPDRSTALLRRLCSSPKRPTGRAGRLAAGW
jgi:hypothetical protein